MHTVELCDIQAAAPAAAVVVTADAAATPRVRESRVRKATHELRPRVCGAHVRAVSE